MTQIVMILTQNHDTIQSIEKHIRKQFPLATMSFDAIPEALRHLATPSSLQPDVVFFELKDEPQYLEAIVKMRALRRDLQIIVMVSHVQIDLAMKSLGMGASDFLVTPFHNSQLLAVVPNAIQRRNLQIQARNAGFGERISLKDIEPESAALSATLFIANQLVENDSHISVQGAHGSGREILARAIHGVSKHSGQPFVAVNAALFREDELYQHCFDWEKGVFSQIGKGTVFLRNMENPGRDFHYALESLVTRGLMGTKGMQPFEGRIVFAVDDASVDANRAQQESQNDMFAKINAISMRMPTLAEMKEDVPRLAMLLGRHYAAVEGKTVLSMNEDVKRMLRNATWPGNLEQLAQTMFDAVMRTRGTQFQLSDFHYLVNADAVNALRIQQAEEDEDEPTKAVLSCVDKSGKVRRLKDVEQEVIQYALDRYSGHMSAVAKHLGIGRSTLYRKIANRGGKK